MWRLGREEIVITSDRPSEHGRVIDLVTPASRLRELEVPFVGRHQSINAALAVAAVEAFTGEATSIARCSMPRGEGVANPGPV